MVQQQDTITMTTKKCREPQNECDTRYILREWLWRGIVVMVVGCIGVIYATGSFVSKTEMTLERHDKQIDDLQRIYSDIDSLKNWVRK
jgi:hypothetical protein